MQQREVESGVDQLQTQGVLPIHAAAHGIVRLSVGEPFDILHDGSHGQAPRRDLNGMSAVGIEICKQVVAIKGAEFLMEVDIEIALGKGGLDGGSGGLGHGGNEVGTPGHVSPPDSENATVQNAVMDRDRRGSIIRFDRPQRITQQSLMWPSALLRCIVYLGRNLRAPTQKGGITTSRLKGIANALE